MTRLERINRAIARLNDEHGRGGKTRVAELLEWDYTTLWRKLSGRTRLKRADERAIRDAVAEATRKRGGAA